MQSLAHFQYGNTWTRIPRMLTDYSEFDWRSDVTIAGGRIVLRGVSHSLLCTRVRGVLPDRGPIRPIREIRVLVLTLFS
jgi:hypothetical protein